MKMKIIRNFVFKNIPKSGQGAHLKTNKSIRNKNKRELKKEIVKSVEHYV